MIVRKKPIEVEAIQWTGTPESLEEIKKLAPDIHYRKFLNSLFIHHLIGPIGSEQVGIDDWIIKEGNGDIHLYRSGIFEKTYEPLPYGRRIGLELTESSKYNQAGGRRTCISVGCPWIHNLWNGLWSFFRKNRNE